MPLKTVRLYVDSAAGSSPQQTHVVADGTRGQTLVAVVPGPGRHTLTVAVVDSAGRSVSASATRVFALPEVAYTATALPDLGGGANAVHVNPAGDVAGWVSDAGGAQQPAGWKAGTLTALPLPPGTSGAVARRVNTAGDVLV